MQVPENLPQEFEESYYQLVGLLKHRIGEAGTPVDYKVENPEKGSRPDAIVEHVAASTENRLANEIFASEKRALLQGHVEFVPGEYIEYEQQPGMLILISVLLLLERF